MELLEIDELPFDEVCRTCLCAGNNSLELLNNPDELEMANFVSMLSQTFRIEILYPSNDLPQKICAECQDSIRRAYNFKIKVQKSTNILLGKDEAGQETSSLVEDKNTQTDPPAANNIRRSRQIIQFDDENFDSMNLQPEDFDAQANPLLDSNPTESHSNRVKTEQTGLTDDEYDSAGEAVDNDQTDLVMIKTEEMKEEEEECGNVANPFNGGEDNEEQGDGKYKFHKCDQCNKCFSRATHLKRHKLTHEEGKIQCTICDKRFTRIDHLNLHIASNHSESKPFKCEVAECQKGFVRQEHLKKHVETKHGDAPKEKETCDLCQKTFSSKKYLRMHMKSHNADGGKGLICKFCNAEFLEKTELNEHMTKYHQNEKPYLCSECGLRFVRNDYLVIHMRRHMGVKPYKCRFCEKGFPRATDLTVHERYHTNEKTHLCNLCGKGFQRAYNLLVHMRVHTGEKPYQCSFCNKSFSQGNDLKAHIRRHTGERFKCDLCNEGFIQGYHLTHHKRTVHGLDVKSHIRRVEKFVSSAASNEISEEQLVEEEIVKSEADQFSDQFGAIQQN